MDSTTVFENANRYIICRYSGDFALAPLLELARAVHDHCVERDFDRALIDITSSEGHLGLIDRYAHAQAISSFWSRPIRLAVVGRSDQLDEGRFWQMATRNRGVRTFVADHLPDAVDWIQGSPQDQIS